MAPALARGLEVLELLAQEESELSLTSIGARLQIPRPSLWRMLTVLKDRGYVLIQTFILDDADQIVFICLSHLSSQSDRYTINSQNIKHYYKT